VCLFILFRDTVEALTRLSVGEAVREGVVAMRSPLKPPER
jgi:hypothetical protein